MKAIVCLVRFERPRRAIAKGFLKYTLKYITIKYLSSFRINLSYNNPNLGPNFVEYTAHSFRLILRSKYKILI